MKLDRSAQALETARRWLPGGVNSPVRAFGAVGGTPPFIARGSGARLEDVDGNVYVDYVGSWGPLILGHADEDVRRAIEEAARSGWTYGAPTEAESALAADIHDAYPSIERLRLVNSGTEATASAVRLARGATGRTKILKFAGCYHGHVDALLVDAGSGALTHGKPSSSGIPAATVQDTVVLPYNDGVAATAALERMAFAACLLEPVAGNMGLVPPRPEFLTALRAACDRTGALLIFDEVMCGFRIARGGAQERYGVRADLTTLGKIVGGGMPLGVYGGRADLMAHVSPEGPVYQAGTLSGNPVAVAAGRATLAKLVDGRVHARLEELAARLEEGLRRVLGGLTRPLTFQRVGSMATLFFGRGPIHDLSGAKACDLAAFGRFHRGMLERGVYLPPSQFEALFLSVAHTFDDIDRTVEAAGEVLAGLEA